jgi:hypothetical protein
MSAISAFFNNALYVSILVILVSSLVSFYIRSRVRDRCLRDFDGYQVTAELVDNKVVWGSLEVYSTGIELLYSTTHRDTQGHVENSYILYNAELDQLQTVYCLHDHQSEDSLRRRRTAISRTYQPSLLRRAARMTRNLFNTFKDAIVQTTNAVLGYRAAKLPQSQILSRHKELTESGAQLISSTVGNAYEPILEQYIGRYVVVEIVRGDIVEEEYGILKEYSAKYIELLNTKLEVPLEMYLRDDPTATARQGAPAPGAQEDGNEPEPPPAPVEVQVEEDAVHVSNHLNHAISVEALRCDGDTRPVDITIAPHGYADIDLEPDEVGRAIKVNVDVRCLADLIVPRSRSVIRHAGKREKLSLDTLLGLDELSQWPWVRRLFDARDQEDQRDPSVRAATRAAQRATTQRTVRRRDLGPTDG